MKSLEHFIVEIEKELQDTIKTESGLELYIDTKFDEFQHRTTEGKILAAPAKYDTGAKAGDTIYFHHHVVINGGSPLCKEDNNISSTIITNMRLRIKRLLTRIRQQVKSILSRVGVCWSLLMKMIRDLKDL